MDCLNDQGGDSSCFFKNLNLHFTSKYDYPFDGYRSNYPEAFHLLTFSGQDREVVNDFTLTQENYNDRMFRSRTYYNLFAYRKDTDEKLRLLYANDPDLQTSFELIRSQHEKFDDRCLENNIVDCENLCHEANGILLVVEEGKYCAHYEVKLQGCQNDLPRRRFLDAQDSERLLQGRTNSPL
jgi:hypothetical protein